MSRQNKSETIFRDEWVIVRLHRAIVSPRLATLVIPFLEYSPKHFVACGPFGVQASHSRHQFYQIDQDGYLKTAAGFLPLVVDACEQQGIAVSVVDRSRWPVLEKATGALSAIATSADQELLNALANNPRGRLVVGYASELHGQTQNLLTLFSGNRCLVVTPNGEQRDKHCAKLSCRLSRPVSTHDDIVWGSPDRVTIITANCFAGVSIVNVDFDVVVFTHPNCVTGDQAFETAVQLNHELLYCFVPHGYQPDALSQFRLEAVCGEVIHTSVTAAPSVHVVMVEAPPIQAPGKLTPLERKRTTIWHNDQRNDLIAGIASAVASGDVQTFSQRCEFLNQHGDLLSQRSNLGIAILVESTEHGRELQRRLPEWTLDTAIPDDDGVTGCCSCHRSIVTQAFASQGLNADVLIRATGTASPLMVRGFPSILQTRAIVLFDLADDFDEQAICDTAARIRDYKSRDWIVIAGNEWNTIQNAREMKMHQGTRGARS
jgi:hypothetical protein